MASRSSAVRAKSRSCRSAANWIPDTEHARRHLVVAEIGVAALLRSPCRRDHRHRGGSLNDRLRLRGPRPLPRTYR
jgi:hypothetical protein